MKVVTVDIPGGGRHDMVRADGAEMFQGTLHGEDAETGERWAMPFWLPGHVVTAWAAACHEPVEGNDAPF